MPDLTTIYPEGWSEAGWDLTAQERAYVLAPVPAEGVGHGGEPCLYRCHDANYDFTTGEDLSETDYKVSPHGDLDYDKDAYWVGTYQEAIQAVRDIRLARVLQKRKERVA